LNEFAARVWRKSDGKTSVAEIAAALGEGEGAVWLALHQLTKARSVFAFGKGRSVTALSVDAAAVIDQRFAVNLAHDQTVVASIVAPMPAQAASCGGLLARCTPALPTPVQGNCCAGLLCVGFRCI
jgi:hypothetical protein